MKSFNVNKIIKSAKEGKAKLKTKLESINFIEIIKEIVDSNKDVITLACRGRSKFEGWLKFEIARRFLKKGFEVFPEHGRFDIAISDESKDEFVVELKTANISYRIKGIENKTRPGTKNFKSIEGDIEKIKRSGKNGKAVFVVFPVPLEDERYLQSIKRVENRTEVKIRSEFYKVNENYGIVLCESEVINGV